MHTVSEQTAALGTPVYYRPRCAEEWLTGELVRFQQPEMMLSADTALELQTDVEILMPLAVRLMVGEVPLNLLCTGRVVRRILANWPNDLRPALVVSISSCQIASEPVSVGTAR